MRLIDNKRDIIYNDRSRISYSIFNYRNKNKNISGTLGRLWSTGIILNMEVTIDYLLRNIYNEIK